MKEDFQIVNKCSVKGRHKCNSHFIRWLLWKPPWYFDDWIEIEGDRLISFIHIDLNLHGNDLYDFEKE